MKHYKIDDHSTIANKFASVYKHMSIAPYDYELFCFQRWFITYDLLKYIQASEFIYLDNVVHV